MSTSVRFQPPPSLSGSAPMAALSFFLTVPWSFMADWMGRFCFLEILNRWGSLGTSFGWLAPSLKPRADCREDEALVVAYIGLLLDSCAR